MFFSRWRGVRLILRAGRRPAWVEGVLALSLLPIGQAKMGRNAGYSGALDTLSRLLPFLYWINLVEKGYIFCQL